MADELRVQILAELDEAESKARILAQLPSIENAIKSSAKPIKIAVEIDSQKFQSQANQIESQIARIAGKTGIRIQTDIDQRNINTLQSKLKEFKIDTSGVERLTREMTNMNAVLTEVKSKFASSKDESQKLVNIILKGVDAEGRLVTVAQQYNTANKEIVSTTTTVTDNIKQQQAAMEKLAKAQQTAQQKNQADIINWMSKMEALKAVYEGKTSSKGVMETANIERLNAAYKGVIDSINGMDVAGKRFSADQSANIKSQIDGFKRLVAEMQNAERAATKLRTKDVGTSKMLQGQELNKLEATLKKAGTLTAEFKQRFAELRAQLNSVGDSAGLTAFLNQFDMLKNDTQILKIQLQGLDGIFKQLMANERAITSIQKEMTLNPGMDAGRRQILESELSVLKSQNAELQAQKLAYSEVAQYSKQAGAYARQAASNERELAAAQAEVTAKARECDAAMQRMPLTIQDLHARFQRLTAPTEHLKQNMKELDAAQRAYANSKTDADKVASYERLKNILHACSDEVTKLNRLQNGGVKDFRFTQNLEKAKADLATIARTWSAFKLNPALNSQFKQLELGLRSINNAADLSKWSAQFARFKSEVKAAGKNMLSFGDQMKNNLSKVTQWFSATTLVFMAYRKLKKAISTVVDLDTALIDLQKVTKATTTQYEQFYMGANDTARELGATTKEIISQTAEWARLGYSMRDAAELAKNSAIFEEISPDMDISMATDGLVSILKAFNIDVEDSLDGIISKVNDVGNKFAVSNGDIVNALTRTSSAMAAANNTFEETVALATAAIEITRDAEGVGVGLKTLSMRIRGYDEETEEFIGGVEKLTGEIADLTKTASNPKGVSLFEEGDLNTYRSTYDILSDIADVWDEISDKEQAQLLEKLFGKRQAQIGAAILSNFDQARNAIDVMANSAGSAEREMDKLSQSLEYKANALRETWTGISQNVFNRNDLSGFIAGLQAVSSAIDTVTEHTGLWGTIATTVFGVQIAKFISSTRQLSTIVKTSFASLSTAGAYDGSAASVSRYTRELETLSAAQQRVVLSTMGVVGAEQEEVMALTRATVAAKQLSVGQLERAAGVEASSIANALNVSSTDQVTAAMLEEAMAQGVLTKEQLMGIVTSNQQDATNKKLAFSFRTLGAEMKASLAAMAANPMTWVSVAIAGVFALVQAYQNAKRKIEEARQAAMSSADTVTQNIKAVEDYKSKALELRAAIDSGNLSESEAYEKRQELLGIEQSLVDMFGQEAAGINLVTGAIDEQAAAIDRLSQSEWEGFRKSNLSAINNAKNVMTKGDANSNAGYYSLGMISDEAIRKTLKQFNPSMSDKEIREAAQTYREKYLRALQKEGYAEQVGDALQIKFRPDDIYEAAEGYSKIYDIIDKISKETLGNVSYEDSPIGNYLSGISSRLSEVNTQISDNEGIFNTYVEGLLNYDSRYSDVWGDILAAQQKYQDAILHGDTDAANAAIKAMDQAKQNFIDAGWDNESVNLYVDRFIKGFEDQTKDTKLKMEVSLELEKDDSELKSQIENALKAFKDENGNVLADSILNAGIDYQSKIERGIEDFKDEELAYSQLAAAAEEYGCEVEDLINVLVDLGRVQKAATESGKNGFDIPMNYEKLEAATNAATTAFATLGDVMTDNTYISEDAYNSLVAFAGGEENLAGCIDTTNGYLVTNAQALMEVVAASKDATEAEINMARAHEETKYHQLVEALQKVCDVTGEFDEETQRAADTLLSMIDTTQMQIAKFAMLEQQLLGTTSAFEKLSAAEEADAARDYTDDASNMIEKLISAYDNHEFGTDVFDVAFSGLIPENVYSQFEEAGKQIDAGWEYLNNKLSRYFTYDNGNVSIGYENVNKFINDALSTKFGDSTVFTGTFDDFDLNPQIKSLQEFADAMGVTTEMAFALGNAISKYTMDNDDFLSKLGMDNLESQIMSCESELTKLLQKKVELGKSGKVGTAEWDEVNNKIKETGKNLDTLKKQASKDVTMYIEIDSQIEEQEAKVDELKAKLDGMKENDVDYNIVAKNYAEAKAQLDNLYKEKYGLEEPTELTITLALEDVNAEIAEVKSRLDEIASYDEEADIYVNTEGTEAAAAEVDSLVAKLNGLENAKNQIMVYADIDSSAADNGLAAIQEFKIGDKKFSVFLNEASYNRTIGKLNTIVTNLNKIKDKTVNVTVNETTNKSTNNVRGGRATAFGTAHAIGQRGNWGLREAEREALVGELGQELVVDPYSGRYYTVGDAGAELVNLPAGAIIFNHKQTEEILRNKKINTRGKALAEGNAHFQFTNKQYKFGQNTTTSSSNSKNSSSKKKGSVSVSATANSAALEKALEEALQKLKEELDKILKSFEHSIFLLERNGGSTEEIVEQYRKMQEQCHEYAQKYREKGLDENSEYIQEVQKQWWQYEDNIREAITSAYKKDAQERENAIKLTENWFNNAIIRRDWDSARKYTGDIIEYYKQEQQILHQQAQYLRSLGYSDISDEVSELSDEYYDLADKIDEAKQRIVDDLTAIVDVAHEVVDTIQNVYDTFHKAADEYAANGGFISIDTVQEIYNLGPQYLQFLNDENGLLQINEERLNKVIAAQVRHLALEQGLSYVERLKAAATGKSNESLQELVYATQDATESTWGLLYAELAQMRQLGQMDNDMYLHALHNLQAIQSIGENAAAGVGKVAGNALNELEKMQSGLKSILDYVIEMLKQQINDQIDGINDLIDQYSDLINKKKESLKASKDEADYQKTLANKLKEIAKIQAKIDALSLDDSRQAQAEKAKLLEELAGLQDDLNEKQADKAIEVAEKALDSQEDAYRKEKEDEIKILEESISSYQKLYDMAIEYIGDHWDTLYDELIAWNTEYGTVLNEEITSAWEDCLAAAERYGDYVTALKNIDYDIAAMSSSSSSSSSNGSEKNYIVSPSTDKSGISQEAKGKIAEMYDNSVAWHEADAAERERLNKRNLQLGAELSALGVPTNRGSDGVWYTSDGEKLFEKYGKYIYHTGGIAGDDGTLKDNEILAKLEKGESVLTVKMWDNLIGMMERVDKMSAAMTSLPSYAGQIAYADVLKGISSGTVNNITNSNQPVEIKIGDVIIQGNAGPETVQQHVKVSENMVNEIARMIGVKM